MSSPSIGIGRITIPYTVDSLNHRTRMYVDNPTLSGSDWVINKRPSVGGTVDWKDAANDLASAISYVLGTGATPGTALLEEYAATGWLPRDTFAVSFPNLAGTHNLATEMTLSLRDSNFTRPKIVVLETAHVAPRKFTSPTGGAGNQDNMIAEFLSTHVGAAAPWVTMVNQHGFFLQENPFISFTTTYNEKLERARGFA